MLFDYIYMPDIDFNIRTKKPQYIGAIFKDFLIA